MAILIDYARNLFAGCEDLGDPTVVHAFGVVFPYGTEVVVDVFGREDRAGVAARARRS